MPTSTSSASGPSAQFRSERPPFCHAVGTEQTAGARKARQGAGPPGGFLRGCPQVRLRQAGRPLSSDRSDRLFATLSELSGRPVPEKHVKERGRLVDSYVDAHKYVFGKRAVRSVQIGATAFLPRCRN